MINLESSPLRAVKEAPIPFFEEPETSNKFGACGSSTQLSRSLVSSLLRQLEARTGNGELACHQHQLTKACNQNIVTEDVVADQSSSPSRAESEHARRLAQEPRTQEQTFP